MSCVVCVSAAREHATLFLISRTRDGFCLFYNAGTKEVNALNGSGRSPEKLTIDHIRRRGIAGPRIPSHDLNSVTVPCVFTSGDVTHFLITDIRMRWPVGGYCRGLRNPQDQRCFGTCDSVGGRGVCAVLLCRQRHLTSHPESRFRKYIAVR